MLILTIDAALAQSRVSLIRDEAAIFSSQEDGRRGQLQLATFARAAFSSVTIPNKTPDLIAVTLGPGSFTGIRAALSLAHGIGLARDIPVIGITIGEALSEALPGLEKRRLWCVIASRRGRVVIEEAGVSTGYSLDALPHPSYRVALAGDAAIAVAGSLAARGADVMLTSLRLPSAVHIAMAASKRWLGELPPRPAQPVYVDPPEAKLPSGGLRPAPGSGVSANERQILQ